MQYFTVSIPSAKQLGDGHELERVHPHLSVRRRVGRLPRERSSQIGFVRIMNGQASDCARSLHSPEAVALRKAMLRDPHLAPLTDFVAKLRRAHPDREFPDFDPLDGGSNADILFLFEKPGRMTSAGGKGSGFISRNNNDPTAEATFGFMTEANLSRNRTVIWNVVPGWNGTRKITKTELSAGVDALRGLLPLIADISKIWQNRRE
jgi:hypothetical protein